MHRDLDIEFKDLVKQVISPRLKSLGYKKRNLNYNRQVDSLIQCIRIQRSQWNHQDRITFTINYGCFNEFIYRLSRNKTESPKFINDNDCFIWGRIGHLIYGKDHWYELSIDSDLELLIGQISKDFDNSLLPLMNRLETIEQIGSVIKQDISDRPKGLIINIDDIAIFELENGDFERGSTILIENYKKALIPKSVSGTTVYPDGRKEVRRSEPKVNQHHIDKLKRIANKYDIEMK